MKTLLGLLAMSFVFTQLTFAQTTEDFETETIGNTSFTDNGQNFTITNGPGETTYDIETVAGAGWNGTGPDNVFIDNNLGSPTQGNGSSFTITTSDGADIYINSFYLFLSTRILADPTPTTLTIVGRKDGVTQYTIVKNSGFSNVVTFSPNNGFTFIDFSTEGGSDNSNTEVDEIVISTTGFADYLALDALNWEPLACTDPTVPTLTNTPATVCIGGTATLNITGLLNDATAWQIYTGSCGGTNIGSTTGSTFAIPGPITAATTYFVRGEGGCVTPGTCGTITITPQALDDASFAYGASAYCVNAADPTPTITGLTGGTFTSSAGLSINGSTGQIDVSASTPGTYTVTYTTAGTCPNSSNVSVTVNALDDPSFSYSAASYCSNEADPSPTIAGLSGGTFSAAGLSINSSTGTIDVSAATPGTYTVTYTTAGACPNATSVIVNINAADDASFSYSASAYCVNAADPTPTITGLAGGTFSSTAGLSMNSATGQIDVSASTPGTYTVTYTTTGACPNTSNVSVTINALDNASFSYSAAAYCVNAADPTPTITGLAGGTFSSTAGLSVNAATGQIDVSASTPGAYIVTYATSGSCPNSSNVSVTINALDDPSFSYSASAYCVNAVDPTPTITGLPGGTFSSTAGLSLNASTGQVDVSASTPGTYTVTYTTSGACMNLSTVSITVEALPTVTFSAPSDLCIDAGVQTGLGSGTPTGGVYSGTGVVDDGNGLTYTFDPALAGVGVHTITYTFTNGSGCTNSASDNIEVFALPTVTFTALADLCLNDGIQAGLGSGSPTGGVYSGAGVVDDGNGTTYSFDPGIAGVGTHTVTYTFTNGNGCTSNASDQVEVFGLPTVTFTAPGPFCSTQGVQTGLGSGTPTGGVYSGTGVTDDGNGMTFTFDPAIAGVGTHTVTYAFTNGNGCTVMASDDIEVTAGGAVDAVCQDIVIYLDGTGQATIIASDIDGGSSVGCGTLNLSASQTTFTCAEAAVGGTPTNDLVITGVYDGPLTGGAPKGVELYVINDISDLSQYGIGSANNGGGTDGEEFTFPAVSVTSGQYIYVASESTEFTNFFGFAPDYTTGAMAINGDDAIELFFLGGVIDVFGDINTDGTGEPWDYVDGWAYRLNDTGNDGANWTLSNWFFSGIDALDGESTNATSALPFPQGSYSMTVATPTSVTLTVTDGLGGSATCTANVTVLDTIAPTITCPTDIIVDQDPTVCSADVAIPTIVTGDNCSGESLIWTINTPLGVSGGVGQPGTQNIPTGVSTVNVTVADASGNMESCSFTITVNDTVAPIEPVLADITDECAVTVTAPTATDLCAGTITGTTTDPLTYSTQGTFVITWSFDDGSGNISTATQNVIVDDITPPTASNIDTVSAECIGDVAIDPTLIDDEADNCTAAPVVAYVGDIASNGTGCNDTITRTYSVTDDAGNSVDVVQIIILNDVTAPTASNPATLNVFCLADVPGTAGSEVWVTDEADNCSTPTVSWLSDVSSNGTGCSDTIIRTFEIADACGNTSQVEQLIIVNDDIAPVLDQTVLDDATGFCDVTPTTPTATDNCAGAINGVPDVTFPINTIGTTVVTWTFTDNCGNSVTQTQNVIIEAIEVGTTFAPDGITLVASNTNAGVTYQWIDCETNAPVAGATNVNFTPTYGSDFAVIITENGCSDTSLCVNSTVGLDQVQLNYFTMYPNPTETGSFTIQLEAALKSITVLDMTGRLVEVEADLNAKTVNVSNLVNGAYIVRVITENDQQLVGTVRVQ